METLDQFIDSFHSDIGVFYIYASEHGISRIIRLYDDPGQNINPNSHTALAIEQLEEYFSGTRKSFSVDLDLQGATTFQHQVWKQLTQIEFGNVINYKDLAILCGDENKMRAVGRANGSNPIPIIIPCHRVIGSNGKLVGFSQGLDMKQYLLEHENAPIQLNLF